jgi:hypothetical protein
MNLFENPGMDTNLNMWQKATTGGYDNFEFRNLNNNGVAIALIGDDFTTRAATVNRFFQTRVATGVEYFVEFGFLKLSAGTRTVEVLCTEKGNVTQVYGSTVCPITNVWSTCSARCKPPVGATVEFGAAVGNVPWDLYLDNGVLKMYE